MIDESNLLVVCKSFCNEMPKPSRGEEPAGRLTFEPLPQLFIFCVDELVVVVEL